MADEISSLHLLFLVPSVHALRSLRMLCEDSSG